MKRFHVHVAVEKIGDSVKFYSTMFGTAPAVLKRDYAKWMLDDPRINFAISSRGRASGVNHLGFQLESTEDFEAMRGQLQRADAGMVQQQGVACCYARSDKYWVTDPAGIAWETFRSLGNVPLYGEDTETAQDGACCVPAPSASPEGRKCCA